jgi:hypothetical protein
MGQFQDIERAQQGSYFEAHFRNSVGFGGKAYRLQPAHKRLNLAPEIQDCAPRYFGKNQIQWHTHCNHALSSQVCCLNFLMPLAEKPHLLSKLVMNAIGGDLVEMVPVETGPDGQPWYVGFEWIGLEDYLNESNRDGKRSRGANATSADAIIRFRRSGVSETLLIEWKYTESYGVPTDPKGNATRIARYENIAFDPDGPVRADLDLKLEELFYEPFYQLLRQQMLAFRMQRARECDADLVRVLHIAPNGNETLKNVTAPALRRFGTNAFLVWKQLLVRPQDFISRTTEELFMPLISIIDINNEQWATYLRTRYKFLSMPI